MSLKRLKRRLSLTFRSNRAIDESLSELAEDLTIEENGGVKENGESLIFNSCTVRFVRPIEDRERCTMSLLDAGGLQHRSNVSVKPVLQTYSVTCLFFRL